MSVELERLAHPKAAAERLGEQLYGGSLSLLLGAGVSKPLGLPSFPELVDKCLGIVGEPPFDGTDPELGATRLGSVCKKKALDLGDVVTKGLYPGGGLTASSLMGSARMGALGAMLMGSARGNVDTVLTLNFDSVLEEYLLLHGYVVNVVTEVPALVGREDVTVFHPHGYLPSATGPGARSEKITLTKESVLAMAGNANHPWRMIIRQLVRSKVLLLLGISVDTAIGIALGSILADEAAHIAPARPTAFWLGADKVDPDRRTVLLEQNVVPVTVSSFDAIDPFLLEVCREASRKIPYGSL